jgi:hypothetical protein
MSEGRAPSKGRVTVNNGSIPNLGLRAFTSSVAKFFRSSQGAQLRVVCALEGIR